MILRKNNVERVVESAHEAEKLKSQGYEVIQGEVKTPLVDVKKADIKSMTIAELRKLAKSKGIKSADSLSKSDLLSVLKEGK